MFRFSFIPNAEIVPGLDFLTYLDGNLSDNGPDEPNLRVDDFDFAWWRDSSPPLKYTAYLSFVTIRRALKNHRTRLESLPPLENVDSRLQQQFVVDAFHEPIYSWHSEVHAEIPNGCARCKLYRAVARGAQDKLRDAYNWAQACETANKAEKEVAARRASGFQELFVAALAKESSVFKDADNPGGGWGSKEFSRKDKECRSSCCSKPTEKGKEREKETGREECPTKQSLKELWRQMVSLPPSKWTWGVNLKPEDIDGMVRGADRFYQLPHSGYDESLRSGKAKGWSSPIPNASDIEDTTDPNIVFEELSPDFPIIRDLAPAEFPTAFAFAPLNFRDAPRSDSSQDQDPIRLAIAEGQRLKRLDGKRRMQEEVGRPVSPLSSDCGSQGRRHLYGVQIFLC
jgi:hypothetical protein